jgi:neopullulanase
MLTILLICTVPAVFGQVEVYPPNWWVGMKTNKVQLLLRSTKDGISQLQPAINYPGLTIEKVSTFKNSRYMAIDIEIAPDAKPGVVEIVFTNGKKKNTVRWQLDKRREGRGSSFAQGVTSVDFINLLIPDRFANGDDSNDRIAGMKDQSLNRAEMYDRHGGDLQGIINHLDYFKQLGVTTLWLLPVLENDMLKRTEHGYAITNHYRVDPRFGGNAKYKELSDALHKNGMKLIMDAVYNHIGLQHFLEQDPPDSTWMHRWPKYTQTSYREQTIFDPYGAPSEKKRMVDGWFDTIMPDINHDNPFMATFLIQNMIWNIEEFGIDGIRIDTYTYNDGEFSNRCNQAIMEEYPKMTLFGETRVFGVVNQAYFNENNLDVSFKSNLPGSVDFQCLYKGIIPALTESFGWTNGVNQLYYTLSSDFINKDASRNVLLLDNHDESRFFSIVEGNVEKQITAYKWLLTCRGIPQMYYGSEVLLSGYANPDGLVRSDFPGGWRGDKKNAFTGEGLTGDEKRVQNVVKALGKFRLTSSALKTGKLMHYIPQDGVYVYFRYDDRQTVMCIMNASEKEHQVDLTRYVERVQGFAKGVNVIDGATVPLDKSLVMAPYEMHVLELK